MANNRIHVSPGVYSTETELSYAVKSLGITTLGVAGETLRGPAFQPIKIEDWNQFTTVFGGTSTEKFKGSQYPKYELPYIAKSYLSESKQLEVVRVLGLSGYKAGPAWVVTADRTGGDKMVVAVLRSRGHYDKYHKFDVTTNDECNCPSEGYDMLVYEVGEIKRTNGTCNVVGYNDIVKIKEYKPLYASGNDCKGYNINGSNGTWDVSATNYGRFTIYGMKGYQEVNAEIDQNSSDYFEYPVSLNPYDKDFILKVLGTNPQDGDAPIYVESLYDVALGQGINEDGSSHVKSISSELTFYNVYDPSDYCGLAPITDMLTLQESGLQRKNLGQRYVADEHTVNAHEFPGDAAFFAHPYDYATNMPMTTGSSAVGKPTENVEEDDDKLIKVKITSDLIGQIFTVVRYVNAQGKTKYFYRYYPEDNVKAWRGDTGATDNPNKDVDIVPIIDKLKNGGTNKAYGNDGLSSRLVMVKNLGDGLFYRLVGTGAGATVSYINCDLNNYGSAYRYASTPWLVSNLKGDYEHIEMNKLFRLHTISDGDNSNREIKVSIENILPDEGLFDVVVRDINDTDEYTVVLERFQKCNLTPGDKNFIGYKIGTFDGIYETKSKFITVEVAEGTAVEHSVPAGFLGYPIANFTGLQVAGESETDLVNPVLKYNLNYDNEVKNRKQYFGLSTRVGVDIDAFTYKRKSAYINTPETITQGFHLDARLDKSNYAGGHEPKITVDGVSGYSFDSVSVQNRTSTLTDIPAIGTEAIMNGSIYEYVNLRKFTVYFYGGFDGWDPYRTQRTNTDDFKMSKYLGTYDKNSGEGYSFNRIDDPESIGLNQNGITSDWYAYLAAYRQFANPEAVDINVFATPGIDYVNNNMLVNEVIDMIQEERADSVYVVTTPDKPSGAADFVDEMYTPEDAVYNLENSEIDSNYTCTYYPWVKYLDQDNNQYIYLPATKDVVRNFALTDNQAFSWFAPAGLSRGDVNCVRAHFITKLADEDVLYDGRINPIKTFATDGVKVWGQKNLQVHESQLNRIAVRRLLLRMRKLIAIACRSLIFEPNDPVTKNMFLTAVTPIMDNIRANRGISDYKIEVEDSIESREKRELNARIFFKPYNALEYINLEFVLTPEGISFDDI